MGAQEAIQNALLAQLRGAAALTNLLPAHAFEAGQKAIYDGAAPPADDAGSDAPFPYVTFGEMTSITFDADDSIGRETTVTLHYWSRKEGMLELNKLMDAGKAALHNADFAVAGEKLVLCFYEFGETLVDPDGLTRHGVQRYRLITEGT